MNNSLNNNSKSKTEENSLQLNQYTWLAEEKNVVLLSLNHKEKIVLSIVNHVTKTNNVENETTSSANLDSKNNQISQVRIITENGQTFDFGTSLLLLQLLIVLN